MDPVVVEVGATPSEIMAYLASLAGSQWLVESANDQLQRVTLRTRPVAFSFGVRVQSSVLHTTRGSRVILEGTRVIAVNLPANPAKAVHEVANLLRRRFPQAV